jgi:hypothetical protein
MEGTIQGKKVVHTNCNSQDRNIGGFLWASSQYIRINHSRETVNTRAGI